MKSNLAGPMGLIREAAHSYLPASVKRPIARIRNRLRVQPDWAIGVHIGERPPPVDMSSVVPIVTRWDVDDVEAAFVADPFAIPVGDEWYLFFEVLNRRTGKGEVGLSVSTDLHDWEYQGTVLRNRFHLSYPQVFEWNGEYFLVPECSDSGAVLLYRAASWPHEWEVVAELVRGPVLLDPSLFRHDGRWWMLVETDRRRRYDTLDLYMSDDLLGPWSKHPSSPVVLHDASAARPAGRVVEIDGRLTRFAQDCTDSYGESIGAFEITRLDPGSYEDRPVFTLDSSDLGDSGGISVHHLDIHRDGNRWVTFLDFHR